ncbi:MAG TPA: hypothetical protein P5158_03800 [Chitinophagaceae bacterium]|nr:hypothetical protein [Chitinophagaceae bacterium]
MSKKEFPGYIRILIFILILLVSLLSIKKKNKRNNELIERGRYAIAETKGWIHNHRSSGFDLDYAFKFKGFEYRRFISLSSLSRVKTKGAKYIVLFDPTNPKNSKLLLDKEVLRCEYENYADTGWIELPSFVILK